MSVTGGILAATGLASAGIGAASSLSASGQQSKAAQNAAQLQYQASQNALDWQKQVFGIQQQEFAPWLQQGTGAINELGSLLGLPGGAGATTPGSTANFPTFPGGNLGGQPSGGVNFGGGNRPIPLGALRGGAQPMDAQFRNPNFGETGGPIQAPGGAGSFGGPAVSMNGLPAVAGVPSAAATPGGGGNSYLQPFTNWNEQFQAPTGITEQNDPGFQARLALGQQALQNSAAARGGLLSGNTATALNQQAQDYASNEYGNVYNRAFNEYAQRYNQFQNQQSTQYNRLANLAGMGQTAASTLGYLGSQNAGQVGNTLLSGAGMIGQNINNAAAARASGIVGAGNAFSGGLGNLGNLALLYNIMGQGGAGNAQGGGGGGGFPDLSSIINYGTAPIA